MIRAFLRALGSAALAVCVSVRVSAANEPSTRDSLQQAGEHFAEGVRLFHDREWHRALLEFERAYELAPDYRVLYNVAICRRSVEDYAGAFHALVRFLAEPSLSGERRLDALELLDEIRPALAQLRVASVPAGAQVRIADAVVGTTPFSSPVVVNPGQVTVVLSEAGFLEVVRQVDLRRGEVAELDIPLTPVVGARHETATQAASSRASHSPRWTNVPAIALLGVAALGVGAGSAFGLATLANKRDLDEVCRAGACPPSSQTLLSAARRDALLSTLGFGLSAAAIGGAVVFVLWPSPAPAADGSGKVRIGGASLGASGTF